MKQVPLTNRLLFALIDDEDYDRVTKYKWYLNNKYARGFVNGAKIYLHRFVLNLAKEDKTMVDHINDNKLDCQKHNLRKCTNKQNTSNQKKRTKLATSKYKGVCWSESHKKWRATINNNRKHKHIGRFENEEVAARAYDYYANKYFGEFARYNFPDEWNGGS